MSKSKLVKEVLLKSLGRDSSLVKTRVYFNQLKNPENNLLKSQLMSHFTSLNFRQGRRATLNRFQNLLQAQKAQRAVEQMKKTPRFKSQTQKFAYYLKTGLRTPWSYSRNFGQVVFGSRPIKVFFLLSFMYGFYSFGRYFSDGYLSKLYPRPNPSLMDKA